MSLKKPINFPVDISWFERYWLTPWRCLAEATESLQIPEELKRKSKIQYVAPHTLSIIYIGLGDYESALKWFERSFEERSDFVVETSVNPTLDPLRDNPRFQELTQRIYK